MPETSLPIPFEIISLSFRAHQRLSGLSSTSKVTKTMRYPIRILLQSFGTSLLCCAGFLLLPMGVAWGEDNTPSDVAELKALLLETRDAMREIQTTYEARIDMLESRIEELEAGVETNTEQQDALERTTIDQQTILEEVQSEARDRLSIHGYYDFQYIDADNEVVGSFIQNELSIFLRSSTEDEQWTVFGELEFERIDGNDYLRSRNEGDGDLEIETAWLEYRHNDRFRVRAGKLLLPQYWQTYHYPNLTFSTLPPLMVGKVFPKSIVALQFAGDWWTSNERGISYALYGGNGGDGELRALDANEHKAIGGRITLRLAGSKKPVWLETLDFSVSAYAGDDDDGRNQSIVGIDTQIRVGRLELLGELARSNQPSNLRRSVLHPWRRDGESLGFYVQPSYRITPQWHMFYRYDYLNLDNSGVTPFDETRHTLGVNYRPRPNISLKLELFHSEPEIKGGDFNGVASSVVFNF